MAPTPWPNLLRLKCIYCEIPFVANYDKQTKRPNIYINSIIIDFKRQAGQPLGRQAARSYRYVNGARHYFLNCVNIVVAISLVTSRFHFDPFYSIYKNISTLHVFLDMLGNVSKIDEIYKTIRSSELAGK
jgi:hypothetical protein